MSVLVMLKEGTRSQHDKLESDLNLLRKDLTLDDYVELLKRFYGIYKPLEPLLNVPVDRVKTPHLEKDLRHFKINPESIPLCENLPVVKSSSQIYGVRYVLEGSTLGGQVLSKHFKEFFYISPDSGCLFFSGYGPETMSKWKMFQSELMNFSTTDDFSPEELLESARDTFHLFNRWLISAL
jgi:heme oxygenase